MILNHLLALGLALGLLGCQLADAPLLPAEPLAAYPSLALSADLRLEPTPDSLRTALQRLVQGLYFHAAYREQANIQVFLLPLEVAVLTPEVFEEALGLGYENPALQRLFRQLGLPQFDLPVEDFFAKFLAAQDPAQRERAATVVALLRTHLHQLRFLGYNSDRYEKSTYYVVGLCANGQPLFLTQTDFWP